MKWEAVSQEQQQEKKPGHLKRGCDLLGSQPAAEKDNRHRNPFLVSVLHKLPNEAANITKSVYSHYGVW